MKKEANLILSLRVDLPLRHRLEREAQRQQAKPGTLLRRYLLYGLERDEKRKTMGAKIRVDNVEQEA